MSASRNGAYTVNRRFFILVPAPEPSGPVKGAIALANALASKRVVTLVTLKSGAGADTPLDSRVTHVSLADFPGGLIGRAKAYAKLLRNAGGQEKVASISMCFSADMVNMFCRRHAVICSSVRGNLLTNYRMDYGLPGLLLAIVHLITLSIFDHVVTMTSAMAEQVKFYIRTRPTMIGNFVDEKALDPYRNITKRNGPMRFVFLGSLTVRKQPLLLFQALAALRYHGFDVSLDVIGTGPLMSVALSEIQHLGFQDIVHFHGHLAVPHPVVTRADALVLPSLSEGVSRAALEALHLGVPCVLRKVDGNAELIQSGFNGILFEDDEDLPDAMMAAAELSRRYGDTRNSLLPDVFRQREAMNRYLELVETVV